MTAWPADLSDAINDVIQDEPVTNVIDTYSWRPLDCQAIATHVDGGTVDVAELQIGTSDGHTRKFVRICGACRDEVDRTGTIAIRQGGFIVQFHPGMLRRSKRAFILGD